MEINQALSYLILGGILGAVGQGIRVIVGLKKQYDEALQLKVSMKEMFDAKRLFVSLLIAFIVGAIAGILGVINYFGKTVTKEFIITLIGIGYAGTDFIEGFVKKAIPSDQRPSMKGQGEESSANH
jgi:uncharacterized membrane protein YoaK (UPF0700 family)